MLLDEKTEKEYFEIYLEFIKRYIPIFRKVGRLKDYMFCCKILCKDCSIENICSVDTKGLPVITENQYKKEIKKHPEYRI